MSDHDGGAAGGRTGSAALLRRTAHALPVTGWLLLLFGYALTTYLNIVTRTQWGPDSRFYLSWTYRYLGHSQSAARSMAFSFLEKQGGTRCPHCFSYGTDWLFGGNGRAVVGPRVVTPGLSAPFVALFGPWGMIVPSIVCYGLAIVVLAAVTSRLYGPRWGLVAGVFMLLTVEVSRWGAMTYTEAPATLFTIAAVALLPLQRRTGRWHVVGYLVLLLLGLSTRQFAIASPCAVALAWLLVAVRDRSLRNPWLPFAAWGLALSAVTLEAQALAFPIQASLYDRYLQFTGTHTTGQALGAIPQVVSGIGWDDYVYVRRDLVLVVVVVLCAISVLWRHRSEISALALGLWLATLALNVLDVVPSYFRYYAPIYPVYLLSAIALVAELLDRRGSLHRSTERVAGRPPAATPTGRPAPAAAHASRGVRRLAAALRTTVPARGWLLLLLLYVVAVVNETPAARRLTPDSRYHLAWIYRLLGRSPASAAHQTYVQLRQSLAHNAGCGRTCWPAGSDWLFGARGAEVVGTHPFGDLLAAPFVALFGFKGMLLPPLLFLAVAVVVVTVLGSRRWGAGWAMIAGASLLLALDFVRWATSTQPDMVASALATGVLGLLPLWPTPRRRTVAAYAVVLVAGLLTAVGFVAVPAGVVLAYLARAVRTRTLRNAWLPYAAVAVVAVVIVVGTQSLLADLGLSHVHAGLTVLPQLAYHRLAGDISKFAPDRVALGILLLAAVAVVLHRRSDATWLAAGALAVAFVLDVWRGTTAPFVPYIAVYPLAAVSAVSLLAHILPAAAARPAAAPDQATVPDPDAGATVARDDVEQASPAR